MQCTSIALGKLQRSALGAATLNAQIRIVFANVTTNRPPLPKRVITIAQLDSIARRGYAQALTGIRSIHEASATLEPFLARPLIARLQNDWSTFNRVALRCQTQSFGPELFECGFVIEFLTSTAVARGV